ncbi:flagellar basal-body rod protein FlgF [Thermomonas sp.]|uniref:flagellar basal-body rod protein FlgF n=1 Tax=Thermomonas sp. TaxID=1971895 RepID=UPI002C8A9823|nr:flagellar basal-body rod protein FlgF [Thermomonas sp.]HRO63599.1 flagellar basal-body rod protein FlgF [Thermomonas sp.]
MIDALYISASGLRSQQEQIDVISNNVANMQTPGFKRSRVSFAEVARQGALDASQWTQSEGGGTRIQATLPVFSEGEIRPTHNATDLAIDGAGFFELETEQGERVYTRAGQFRIDAEGYLVSAGGLRLAQGVRIPQDAVDLRISDTGEITARLADDTERTTLGALELASFASPDALQSLGDNNFAPTDASGAASFGRAGDPGFGRLQQGYVEMANVDLIDEMTSLVMAQRAYQLNARVLQASDQIMETINNLRR